jgi:cytochrome P450
MDEVIREAKVQGLFNAEGEDWKRHRTVVTKGLDVRHQQRFYPELVAKVEILYEKWRKDAESGAVTDIQRDLLRFTVDITTQLAFGYDIDTMRQEGGVIQDHMEIIFPTLFERINMPFPLYRYIKTRKDRKFDRAVQELNKIVDVFITDAKKRIEEQPEIKENPSNLLESILVAAIENKNFSMDEVRGNLMTVLMAGEDTTAHTLTWIIYLLLDRKDVTDRIMDEAKYVFPHTKVCDDYSKNMLLRYCEAVAQEGLRLKPVAPILLHEALEDCELEEFSIKKGQKIITQYRAAALKAENFSHPDQFIPERWLKGQGCPVHNVQASTPFGAGPRYCPGRNLAMLEIRSILSMLYSNFEVELAPDESVEEVMAFTMMANSLRVRLKLKS